MKKLVVLFLVAIIGISCSKSDDDEVQTTYTVSYSVTSTGDVAVDTIMYMNESGSEVVLLDQNNFNLSFNSVNNYHGKIYVSGMVNNGECDYCLKILEGGGINSLDSSGTISTSPMHFTFSSEYSHQSSK